MCPASASAWAAYPKVNGYVAEYKDADDLARGLHWTLDEADRKTLGEEAVKKVAQHYSQRAVAARYINIYNRLAGKDYLEA